MARRARLRPSRTTTHSSAPQASSRPEPILKTTSALANVSGCAKAPAQSCRAAAWPLKPPPIAPGGASSRRPSQRDCVAPPQVRATCRRTTCAPPSSRRARGLNINRPMSRTCGVCCLLDSCAGACGNNTFRAKGTALATPAQLSTTTLAQTLRANAMSAYAESHLHSSDVSGGSPRRNSGQVNRGGLWRASHPAIRSVDRNRSMSARTFREPCSTLARDRRHARGVEPKAEFEVPIRMGPTRPDASGRWTSASGWRMAPMAPTLPKHRRI